MKSKKIFQIIFAFIFTFAISFNALALSPTSDSTDYEYLEMLDLNWSQTVLADKINTRLKEYYNDSFPSYFGGLYISDDSKTLIIQIVKNDIPKEGSDEYYIYNEIINMGDSIKVEYANNSFTELNYVNNQLVDYMINGDKSKIQNMMATYIDTINNTVVVELADNNEKQQESFNRNIIYSKSIDFKLINFIQSEKYFTYASNLNPGESMPMSGYTCSIGFRTRWNGKDGFLTAGHCVGEVGSTNAYGTIRLKQFAHNQIGDYAFIETHSWLTPTNNLYYTVSGITKLAVINNSTPAFVVGTAIAKVGFATQYTTGKVTDLSVAANVGNGVVLTGLVKSNVPADNGDSGGVVFIPRTDANGGAIPIGILSGGKKGLFPSMTFSDIGRMPVGFISGRY